MKKGILFGLILSLLVFQIYGVTWEELQGKAENLIAAARAASNSGDRQKYDKLAMDYRDLIEDWPIQRPMPQFPHF